MIPILLHDEDILVIFLRFRTDDQRVVILKFLTRYWSKYEKDISVVIGINGVWF